jgi:hypothetical protein
MSHNGFMFMLLIDVLICLDQQETAAAVKLQSVFRRNKVMKYLEDEGRTTAVIRNRSRRRKARMSDKSRSGGADIPNIFACCGVGLAFGDATEENFYLTRQHERFQYEEEKKHAEATEEQLRQQYAKTLKTKVMGTHVEESFEVVE